MQIPPQGPLVLTPNDSAVSSGHQSPPGAVEARLGSLISNLSSEGREVTVGIDMGMGHSLDCHSAVPQGMIAVQDEELW